MSHIVLRLRSRIRQLWLAIQFEIQAFWRSRPVRIGTVLYESFAGNGVLCNPEALFRALLIAPDMQDLRHVWVLDDMTRHREIRHEFADNPNVRFVRYRSSAYFRWLATSQYLVNNATFPSQFSKRADQVYLNTWHGTPLKHMGYDMPDGAADSGNTLRNFVAADFLLSQNAFMTEQMYETAYKLRGIFRGLVIEEGYPRVDRQFLKHDDLAEGRRRLETAGVPLGNRKIILYAPTWKGDSFSSPDDDVDQLVKSVTELQALLGEDRYVVLLKTHQAVHTYALDNPALSRILVSNELPTNVVLGLSSLLITDYSSIFFDFLATGCPIIFYTPDADDYSQSRGTYFPRSEWPGPICSTVSAVAEAIEDFTDDEGSPQASNSIRYAAWQKKFAAHDTGNVANRVIDIVFRGHRSGYRTSFPDRGIRTSILIHLGGMRSNGITSSALNLLSSINYEQFDVSVTFARPRSIQQLANQARIDPHVRQFPRRGGMNGSKFSHLRRKLAERHGHADLHRTARGQKRIWDDEWTRCFGNSRFDIAVDFSGYSTFWAILLLHSPQSRRSIWLHNDMIAESHRVIRGKRRMRRALLAVFDLYREFDSLISVSPSLNDVNRRSFASYGLDSQKFVSARNLIDFEHIRANAKADLRELDDHPRDVETDEMIIPAWVNELLSRDGTIWFVTVGRFSTEKNQARLLRAFATAHAQRPHTRLLLVGYGPLRAELERVIEQLQLTNVAFVVGPHHNPFPIVAAADCFVLSSDYEGQPMVILEAALLGLPIVSVQFDSVQDALPNGGIHVVAQDDGALAEGMLAFERGEVLPTTINAEIYNGHALEEFLRAIGSVIERKPTAA